MKLQYHNVYITVQLNDINPRGFFQSSLYIQHQENSFIHSHSNSCILRFLNLKQVNKYKTVLFFWYFIFILFSLHFHSDTSNDILNSNHSHSFLISGAK